MIALSDIIILTVSSAVLTVALARSYGSGEPLNSGSSQRPPATTGTRSPSVGQPTDQSNSTYAPTNNSPSQPISPADSANDPARAANNGDNATAAGTTVQAPPTPAYATYIVRSGDSLSKIANNFGTTVSELQTINGLTSTRILVGQSLQYPQQ